MGYARCGLWKDEDRAAQALMAEFYRQLWQQKTGKLEALRAMLRGYDRQRGRLRGPAAEVAVAPAAVRTEEWLPLFFWAAFVMSGDWR